MELKKMSFNRTIVELKLLFGAGNIRGRASFNRTIVELKPRISPVLSTCHDELLIEPLWN